MMTSPITSITTSATTITIINAINKPSSSPVINKYSKYAILIVQGHKSLHNL